MTLLRIGNQTINLDRVDEITVMPKGSDGTGMMSRYVDDVLADPHPTLLVDVVDVLFGGGGDHGRDGARFYGGEADAFIRWLDANAVNLVPDEAEPDEMEPITVEGGAA